MTNSSTQAVVDLHVHPSLKIFLFDKKLHKNYRAGGAWNPFTMRVCLPKIEKGAARALVCSHYIPEKKMIDDCWLLKSGFSIGGLVYDRWKIIRKKNPYKATKKMINRFEKSVKEAQDRGFAVTMAKSKTELNNAIAANKIALLHAVEGAHSLDGKLHRLDNLFDMGVCMLTLAHFYENEATQTVGGIPPDKKFCGCFKNEKEQHGGLLPFGKQVVDKMIDKGMIIDMTHCTKMARTEIFDQNANQRPLVISHVGVHEMKDHQMNPTDPEIKQVAESGGVVGIIFYNYWLKSSTQQKDGLDLITATAEHIKNIVNIAGIEHVAIGSDFDGFTDPPDDINDAAMYPDLQTELKNSGFTDADIEKIFEKNALRVIEQGWGKI